jgi:hypothetical protein
MALDKNTAVEEDGTSQLADALVVASESLTQSITDFKASIPDLLQKTGDTLSTQFSGIIDQFQSSANLATSGFSDSATGKIDTARNQTSTAIEAQATTGSDLVKSSSNSTQVNELGPFLEYLNAWQTESSDPAYAAVTASVSDRVTNMSSEARAHAQYVNGNLTATGSTSNQISSSINTATTNIRNAIASSTSNRQNLITSVGQSVSSVLSSLNQMSNDAINGLSSIASGAPDSVGTNSQSALQNLNTEYTQVQTNLGNSVNTAATGSSAAASALSQAASVGNNAVDAARGSINQNIQDNYAGNLGGMNSIAGSLTAHVDTGSVLAAGANAQAQALAIINTAMNTNGTTKGLLAGVNAENSIQTLAELISGNDTVADNAVLALEAAIAASQSNSSTVNSMAKVTDLSVRDALANSDNMVGDMTEKFSDYLTRVLSSLGSANLAGDPANANAVTGLAGVVSGVSSGLASAQKSMDDETTAALQAGQSAASEVSTSESALAAAVAAAQEEARRRSEGSNQAALDADAGVNSALAQLTSSGSSVAGSQASAIQSLENSIHTQLAQVDTDSMTSVRDLAASVDAVLEQMHNYMQSNIWFIRKTGSDADVKNQTIANVFANARAKVAAIANSGARPENLNSLQTDLRDLNSTAAGKLQQIVATLTTVADRYTSSLVGKINERVTAFGEGAGDIQSQLRSNATAVEDGLSASTVNNSLAGEASLESLYNQLQQVAQNASTPVAASLVKSAEVSGVFSATTDVVNSASKNANFASEVMGNLTTVASTLGANATALATGLDSAQTARTIAANQLSEKVAVSNVQAQRSSINTLNGATTDAAKDLAGTVQASIQEKFNQAGFIHDKLAASQAKLDTQIGRILQNVATASSNRSETVKADSGQIQFQLAALRSTIMNLSNIFKGYVDGSSQRYTQSNESTKDFMASVAMMAKKELGDVDVQLQGKVSDVIGKTNLVENRVAANITENELDSRLESINSKVESWVETNLEKIATLVTKAEETRMDEPAVMKTVHSDIDGVVVGIAEQAKQNLVQHGLTVPARITDIISSKSIFAA